MTHQEPHEHGPGGAGQAPAAGEAPAAGQSAQAGQSATQAGEAAAGRHASECLSCPLCTSIAALRQARPEVMEHLLKAGAELLAAARALLDAGDGGTRRPVRLQRIDIG